MQLKLAAAKLLDEKLNFFSWQTK